MKNKSNKHKLYFCDEFIRELKFDKKEDCHLLNATRYYLGKKLVGLLPFDFSFFAYKGEIIKLLGENMDKEDYFKLMTTPIPKIKKEECNHGTLKKCVSMDMKAQEFPSVFFDFKPLYFYRCDKCQKEFNFNE